MWSELNKAIGKIEGRLPHFSGTILLVSASDSRLGNIYKLLIRKAMSYDFIRLYDYLSRGTQKKKYNESYQIQYIIKYEVHH